MADNFRTLRPIEPWISEMIEKDVLFVLRDKSTHRPLNVSYSRDGLKWTTDSKSQLLYFKNAMLRHNKVGNQYIPYFDGDLTPSDKVYVEKFVPRNHYRHDGKFDIRNHLIEIKMVDKAIRLINLSNQPVVEATEG